MKAKKINISYFKDGRTMSDITKLFNGDVWCSNNFQNRAITKGILVFGSDLLFRIDESQPANNGATLFVDSLGRIEIKH